jgi:hypothetical protein
LCFVKARTSRATARFRGRRLIALAEPVAHNSKKSAWTRLYTCLLPIHGSQAAAGIQLGSCQVKASTMIDISTARPWCIPWYAIIRCNMIKGNNLRLHLAAAEAVGRQRRKMPCMTIEPVPPIVRKESRIGPRLPALEKRLAVQFPSSVRDPLFQRPPFDLGSAGAHSPSGVPFALAIDCRSPSLTSNPHRCNAAK